MDWDEGREQEEWRDDEIYQGSKDITILEHQVTRKYNNRWEEQSKSLINTI